MNMSDDIISSMISTTRSAWKCKKVNLSIGDDKQRPCKRTVKLITIFLNVDGVKKELNIIETLWNLKHVADPIVGKKGATKARYRFRLPVSNFF